MRKLILFLFAATLHATTLTGLLYTPSGALATGTLTLTPPTGTTLMTTCGGLSGGATPGPQNVINIPVINGVLQNPPAITGNDCLQPPRTVYGVSFFEPATGNTYTFTWAITGTSYDITNQPVGPTPASVAVQTNPGGDQVISQPSSSYLRVNNFQVSRNFVGPEYPFANLPLAPQTGTQAVIIDALSPGNCSQGGGASRALCRYTGTGWEALGGANGAGGGSGALSVPSASYTGTSYLAPGGGAPANATEAAVQLAAPVAGTVANLTATVTVAPGAGNSLTLTFRKGGASQTVTCQIANTATTCSDFTHSFSVVQGDLIDIQVVAVGTPAATSLSLAWATPGQQGPQGSNGQGYTATSISSVTIGTGSQTFATQANLAYTAGARVRATDANNAANYVEGLVTSYSGTSLVMTADTVGGSGTITSWNINLAGNPGLTGATGSGYKATSTTSLTIGTGSQTLTTQASLAYSVGARVRISSTANTANYMEGLVTSYSGTTLIVNVDRVNGSGTGIASWNINLVGDVGATGNPGNNGNNGSNGAGYNATSATSMTIGTGSQTFATQSGLAYSVGARVRVSYVTTPTDYMEGILTTYSGTSMTVNFDATSGSGTFANWNINLAGNVGQTGAGGGAGITHIMGTTGAISTAVASGHNGYETFKFDTALTGAITISIDCANCQTGQLIGYDITQNASLVYTITWPAGTVAGGQIYTTSTHGFQLFRWDGTELVAVTGMIDLTNAGLLAAGPAGTFCTQNPTSGNLCSWFDQTDNTIKVRDSSGNIYPVPLGKTARDANKFVTYIDQHGVQQTSVVALADLPGAGQWTVGNGAVVCTLGATCKPYSGGFGFSIGDRNNTATLTTSSVSNVWTAPYACTITSWGLTIDTGTITVKFWKIAAGTNIPTSANAINTSGLSIATGTALSAQTTLTDFTTLTVTKGDMLAMAVTAVSGAHGVAGVLECVQ